MNLFGLLEQAACRFPDHGAVYRGTDLVWTYSQLRHRALQIASSLRADGNPGDRVVIASENRPEFLEILFGIWAAGMVAVPLNAKLHAREMLDIITDAEAAWIFVSAKNANRLDHAIAAQHDVGCRPIVIGEAQYVSLMDSPLDGATAVAPDTLAWLFYTSGTTGKSKGAMLSHRNLRAMTIAHLADVETVDERASLIHGAPMSHGSGLYILPYVARGARQVVPASSAYEPAEFLNLCDTHPACGAFLAPTMVQRLRLEAERLGRRPANLRTIVYGGGPMYVAELKKAIAVFGPVFTQIYGQGESPMTITCLRRADHDLQDEHILGSVGWARSGVEVVVLGADNQPAPVGESGEIVCRGDVVMSGYWNNPDATANTLRDGWLHTGDIGSLDERGYLTLRDRSKDVIISGGSNIYPREVEEALLTHAAVSECCVVGRPDAEWGEIVVAFVVRAVGTDLTSDSLDAHCLSRIARFKRPKQYVFIDTLPKNSTGKVLKRELRQWLAALAPT
jgi:acyl-CoA synthetase (AMP-forming)/AMP-acid ligase II